MDKHLDPNNIFLRKNIVWIIISLAIAGATIWAMTAQNKYFSFKDFLLFIKNSNHCWLSAAIIFMLGFIFFEALSLLHICSVFGYKRKKRNGFIYSAADIYFSAITPSATGGQPMSAYFMMKDGIPGPETTVALLLNIIMYTAAIIFINVLNWIFRISCYNYFNQISHILIVIGIIIQIVLLLFFICCLKNSEILLKCGYRIIDILSKLHIIRDKQKNHKKLKEKMDSFKFYSNIISNTKHILLCTFVYNLFQRMCIIAVSVCCFMATGGNLQSAAKIWGIQSTTILGSISIPIPGAMGVTDYLMTDGFSNLMSPQNARNLELLSRSLSFYICIVLCGITVLVRFISSKLGERKC